MIFVPSYLNGKDGVFNVPYYDLLAGADLSLFPSYYEPWGYTPLESLAFKVPTVTTTFAGFGQWLNESEDLTIKSGAIVVERTDDNYQEVVTDISNNIAELLKLTESEFNQVRVGAQKLSRLALWENQLKYYTEIYSKALKAVHLRKEKFRKGVEINPSLPETLPESNLPTWRKLFVETTIPEELYPLMEISQNVWWSWNRSFLHLLQKMDAELWEEVKNPVAFLRLIDQQKLTLFSTNSEFTASLATIYNNFKKYLSLQKNDTPSVAYFSMEFGLDASIHLYSGGLGVLAGDYLKQASDDNVNLTGIGLLYQYGYFKQQISVDGYQIAHDDENKFTHLPILPVFNENNEWLKIEIPFPGRKVAAKIWRLPVGRISLYLLDTNIPENNEEDRYITDRLYGGK